MLQRMLKGRSVITQILGPQHPLIDDNGDKIGHPWDELEDDGDLEADTFL